MNEHEEKIKAALAETFGESATRLHSAINVKSFNLGNKTPLEHVANGGCVRTAVEAIRPSVSGS